MVTPLVTTTETNFTFDQLRYETLYVAGVSSVYTSGESEIKTIDFEIPVGVINIATDKYFTVYPNPTKDKVNITSYYSIDKVEIFNALGILVVTNENYVDGIDVSKLTEGIYFVHITSDDKVVNKKVSISK